MLSSDYESFSLVLIEAMSCSLPVVTVNCPYGPRAIVKDGETGLLAAPTPTSLSEKMEWMMTHEADRRVMGRQARISVAQYKQDDVMRKWETVYNNLK